MIGGLVSPVSWPISGSASSGEEESGKAVCPRAGKQCTMMDLCHRLNIRTREWNFACNLLPIGTVPICGWAEDNRIARSCTGSVHDMLGRGQDDGLLHYPPPFLRYVPMTTKALMVSSLAATMCLSHHRYLSILICAALLFLFRCRLGGLRPSLFRTPTMVNTSCCH